MAVIIVLGLVVLAVRVAQFGATVLADVIATATAAAYYWRRERITAKLLAACPQHEACDPMAAWTTTRVQRRLMAKSLNLSLAMTAHFSLFPRSSQRGYAIAETLLTKA